MSFILSTKFAFSKTIQHGNYKIFLLVTLNFANTDVIHHFKIFTNPFCLLFETLNPPCFYTVISKVY